MQFFTSPEDLRGWVKSQPTPDEAVTKIMDIFQDEQNGQPSGEEDIVETCKAIYTEDEDGNASKVLFGILAKHDITQLKEAKSGKGVKNMNKKAQAVQSRQKNNWVRGERNKWNRVVDGFNEGTPWRVDRDQFYNFTHYYTDALSFDADPNRVYSGEAIWRMYIMDKFTRDYQDKDGRVVGGYINDRFHRFPTAGTPANPDVDRCQGNQMELAPRERSRKPRPHQYSTERRLEEARGSKTEDLTTVVSQAKAVVKLASTQPKVDDKIYSIFKDTLEMREAGIDYSTMLEAVSDHYKVGIMGVAQIDKIAQDLKKKHDGIAYVKEAAIETAPQLTEKIILNPNGLLDKNGNVIPTGYSILQDISAPNLYAVKDPQGNILQEKVEIPVVLDTDAQAKDILDDSRDLGLLEEPETETNFPVDQVPQESSTQEVLPQNQ